MNLVEKPSRSGGPSHTGTRIVAAITARERTMFLESSLARSPLTSEIYFAEETALQPERWTAQLAAWRPEILITAWSTPPIPEPWLSQPGCPLRYVSHIVGSIRQLVPRAFIEQGGLVTNWGEHISGQVAEHGLLLALAALRNQSAWGPYIARPISERHITDIGTRSLFGLRIGLHGFGSVARALLPLLRPFGVTLTAYSAGVPDVVLLAHGVKPAASLNGLFAESDVLFECESLTPSTRQSVTGSVFAALPDHAIFVNIGRGAVVDDDALVREGLSGRIRLALDVVTVEPLTPDSPFMRIPGIVISPHIAGPTFDRYASCGSHALANVTRYLTDGKPTGAISLASYDRAT
jgi:phosphoglycerate dehydrogenase-like enzyme